MESIEILDPGLRRLGGHHFDLDRFLAHELVRGGHHVRLWVSSEASRESLEFFREEGLEVRRAFRDRPYQVVREFPQAPSGLGGWQDQLSEDLARVPTSSHWLWPTTFGHYLGPASRVGAQTEQSFGVFWSPGFKGRAWVSVWESALEEARGAKVPRFFSYDEGLVPIYRRYLPSLGLRVAPYPWRLPNPTDRRKVSNGQVLRVGLLGHQREDRGLPILQALLQKLLEQGFHVVFQDSQGSLRLREQHPRVEWYGWVKDFGALVRSCDIVLWPSDPAAYHERTSGVVPDCIANGVPVVLPSGCLPAETAARFGCGHLFHEVNVESMVRTVVEVRHDWTRAGERADRGASRWRATQGLVHWGDWWENERIRGKA